MQEGSKIWMDGTLVDWKDAHVHVLTHSLHYGLGMFEGIRCYKGPQGSAIFRLSDHVDRLFASANIGMVHVPFSKEEISTAILNVVRANALDACYIRPLIYLGYGEMGLYPSENLPVRVAIAAWPWGTYLGEDGLLNGIRAKVSSYARHHVNSNMPLAKISGYYVNSIMAKQEVKRGGYDEAILLDTDGYVAEATGENIFIVRRGRLKTPPLQAVLEGITRNSVFQIARDFGFTVKEERFGRDEMYSADEVFLTGTAAEITPLKEIDNRAIGEGKPGPITKKIQCSYFDTVSGKSDTHSDWLTPV
ncbi:MAG: branched chain amino acid aminotransferase [Nitrospiraceae bacterium]|nr:branched chain amino acid aminotransferase [Nitrospiraceae bacterium]|tara:strand:+ start:342 stop:1256 length:915 start_codon:yes stop_codon:yes gene_type:complete